MLYNRNLNGFTTTPPLLYSLDNTSPHLTTSHHRNVNSSTAPITHPWKVLNPFHVAEPRPNQFWPETSPIRRSPSLETSYQGGGGKASPQRLQPTLSPPSSLRTTNTRRSGFIRRQLFNLARLSFCQTKPSQLSYY